MDKEYMKEYRQKPEVKEKIKEYNNSEKVKERNRLWKKRNRTNPEYVAKERNYQREYTKRDYVKKKTNFRNKLKRQYFPNFRIAGNLRMMLYLSLRNYTKKGKIMSSEQYGIDYKAIIEHLKPFPENISEYHVDHIKPLCSFDLEDPEEVKKAFAQENHQWLLAEDNLKKIKYDKSLSIGGKIVA